MMTAAFAYTVLAGAVLFGILGFIFPAPSIVKPVKPEPRRPIVGPREEDERLERSRR